MSKVSDDEKLRRYGVRLAKAADRALAKGEIDLCTYRDVSWKALQMVRPRECMKVTGLAEVRK